MRQKGAVSLLREWKLFTCFREIRCNVFLMYTFISPWQLRWFPCDNQTIRWAKLMGLICRQHMDSSVQINAFLLFCCLQLFKHWGKAFGIEFKDASSVCLTAVNSQVLFQHLVEICFMILLWRDQQHPC